VERSPEIGMAAARVREARGLEQSAGGSLWPSVDVDAGVAHGGTGAGSPETTWQAAGMASFEVDVFGKARDSAGAASAGAAAAVERPHPVLEAAVVGV
jgi:outer membrane protein TolC